MKKKNDMEDGDDQSKKDLERLGVSVPLINKIDKVQKSQTTTWKSFDKSITVAITNV